MENRITYLEGHLMEENQIVHLGLRNEETGDRVQLGLKKHKSFKQNIYKIKLPSR
jgi:hypothetical protein